ncbi:MAG: DNA-formamidopyrimidine glycosylase [Isosphaeraceae bacterium]
MPELPEVETMVRGLRPALVDQVIASVRVVDPFLLQGASAEEFERVCEGPRVVEVLRRGKWVVMVLDDRRGLIVIQPRMTGGFRLEMPDRPEHIRVVFHLEQPERAVWFCDTRRLGKVAWYADADEAERTFARSQGPDALKIALDDLSARLARTARGIKAALMDQKVLAGIGNIYADEVLFRAKVHPERPASELTPADLGRIHDAIGGVLNEAIAAEGSSFDAGYRTVLGLEGGFLTQNAVHRRQGEPCPACGEPIVKTRIPGLISRPTYFCSQCQSVNRTGGGPSGPSGRRGRDRVS